MKKYYLAFISSLLLSSTCSNKEKYETVDKKFVKEVLAGNYDNAYNLIDSEYMKFENANKDSVLARLKSGNKMFKGLDLDEYIVKDSLHLGKGYQVITYFLPKDSIHQYGLEIMYFTITNKVMSIELKENPRWIEKDLHQHKVLHLGLDTDTVQVPDSFIR